MDNQEILNKLYAFANKYGLTLETHGEVGFGRECVGFIDARGENYLDYNPYHYDDYEEITELYDPRFFLCKPKDAYHKHGCFAVLVHNDDYDEALKQLCEWFEALEENGEMEVVSYSTGATGIQALISGAIGYAMRFK